ncbi:retrovirus-related pol polyprotein from transposon TNT 1-94 [Tanacetum coccineum]
MCDKKNSVLFNDTKCIILTPNFKLIDESQVLLGVPRKNNMYSVDLKNIVPKGGLTCLLLKPHLMNLNFGIEDPKSSHDNESELSSDNEKKVDKYPRKESKCNDQEKEDDVNNTNNVNAAGIYIVGGKTSIELPFDPNMPALEDYNIFDFSRDDEDHDAVADMNTLDTGRTHNDLQNCLFACFLSQEEPKKDESGIVIRNKARLVSHGYTQEEGIDYDEVYAPIARIKAIRVFLAYASFKDFVVYQMDVKSAFLYGKIEEEVYLLELVYVDDIIFGLTKKELCIAFEKLIHEKFQMSSMGELTFFLGLQVQQNKDGIFISQEKYVDEILKKFWFTEVKIASTPMETQKPLLKDENGKEVDVHMYRYLKGQPKLGHWYPKDSPFELVAYTHSDHARASLDRKSTIGEIGVNAGDSKLMLLGIAYYC